MTGFRPHSRLAVALVAALMTGAIARPAAAQSPPSRVLVMPFVTEVEASAPGGAGATLWLGEAAAVLVGEGLANLGIATFTRDERVAAFDRLQLPMTSALTRATMIRVGELIGASEIVFGDLRLGQTLNVRARVIRLGTGQEHAPVTDAAPLAEIFTLFKRIADRVVSAAGRKPMQASAAALPSLSLEAFESYVKGLVAATPAAEQRFLEDARRQAPGDARILLALWDVYTAQDFHDRALGAANAVAADSPLVLRARFAVALSLIALKRLDGAFQELATLTSRASVPAVANALGVVQLRRSSPAGTSPAVTYFKRAVDADPENTIYLFNLGYAHAVSGNAADALTWLRETARFNAADGDTHLVMSSLLAMAGQMGLAQRELDLARSLGTSAEAPTGPPVARVPIGLERLPASLDITPAPRPAAVSAAQRDQQQTAAFHLARARTLVAERKDREAQDALRRAIYLSPNEDEPHLLLGQLYRRAGRLTDAIDEFKVAIWCRETASAQVALGDALLESGDREGARRAGTRAVALAPTSADAQALLKRTGN